MAFNPATICNPQYVAITSAAQLVFGPQVGTAIPAGALYQINASWVSNPSALPCWVEIYRVPSGGTAAQATRIFPRTVLAVGAYIPVSPLWGAELNPGDTLWGLAQTASSIVFTADGGVNVG